MQQSGTLVKQMQIAEDTWISCINITAIQQNWDAVQLPNLEKHTITPVMTEKRKIFGKTKQEQMRVE